MPEQPAQTLPEGFTGVFYFTNPTDTEFSTYWDSVRYTFPPNKTVPLIIPSESSLGVQEIRKKFARELATQIFYGTDKYKLREASAPPGEGKIPAIFTEEDLKPYVQMCIEPLPLDNAKMEKVNLDDTDRKLRRDEEGKRRTKVLKSTLSGDSSTENLIPEGAQVL